MAIFAGFTATSGYASPLPATAIVNRAQLHAVLNGQDLRVESNGTSDRIDEVLDVALVGRTPTPLRLADRSGVQPASFSLQNRGNGAEPFVVTAEFSGGGARLSAVAIDVDDDGAFNPAVDVVLGADGETPLLAPGASLQLLALLEATGAGEGTLIVRAWAATGTGPPGSLFAGRGDGGSDAMTGATTAWAAAMIDLLVTMPALSIVKSQQVLAADGSGQPARGAIIRYTIETRLDAGAGVTGARIVDPLPVGTSYVVGSLQLDGTALSEADDNDPGRFQNGEIDVALGDLATPSARTVTFDVKIN